MPDPTSPDFGDELRQLAADVPDMGPALSPAQVMRRGDARRRGRVLGQCALIAAVLAAAGGVAATAATSAQPRPVAPLTRSTGGPGPGHVTRGPVPSPSPAWAPTPSRQPQRSGQPTPPATTPARHGGTPTPSPSAPTGGTQVPSPTPHPSRSS